MAPAPRMDTLRGRGARLGFTAKLLLEGNPGLPAALLAVAGALVLAASEAGYYPTTWYAAALFLLALLTIMLLTAGHRSDPPAPALVAVALLSGYALWCFLSIAWAGNQAVAWDGANRVALYAVVLALFTFWRFDARGARIVLATLGLGLAGIGLVELLKANGSSDPAGYFIDLRFAQPAGYINANVALWALGIFPCLLVASARESPAVLRAACLGGAGLLSALALMGQSRGWILTMPIAVAVFLLASPRRVRALIPAVAVIAGTVAVAGRVLAVHDDAEGMESLEPLLSDATAAILVMAGALVLAGLALAAADRRLRPTARQLRAARIGTAVAVVLVLGGGIVAFVAVEGSPFSRLSTAWSEFKGGESQAQGGSSRFTTAGSNRYDFWSVSWDLFSDRPLAGQGAENFQEDYLRVGKSDEQPRFPHSLPLGVLSQTGLVGLLLMIGMMAAAAIAVARAARSPRAPAAAAAVAAGATSLYWLLHASVDWFWEFPGLTVPALAMLGLAMSLGPRRGRPVLRIPRPAAAGSLAAAAVLALSFAGPWLSAVYTQRSAKGWTSNLEGAYAGLDRARRLNPASPRPDLIAATIALRVNDSAEAERRFRAALERQPDSAYSLFELGVIEADEGRRGRALPLLRRALRLTPRDGIVQETLNAAQQGKGLSRAKINRRLLKEARGRVE